LDLIAGAMLDKVEDEAREYAVRAGLLKFKLHEAGLA
jgi:hypothetical protein